MPSSIAHGLTALALGAALLPPQTPRSLRIAGVATAVLLDIDAVGRPFGWGDIGWLGGHRALTHSIPFAVAVAGALTFAWRRRLPTRALQARAFLFFASAMMAHGLFDAFTGYGEGVAFLAPFSSHRYASTWEPFAGLWEEVFIVWLPAWLFIRYITGRQAPQPSRS